MRVLRFIPALVLAMGIYLVSDQPQHAFSLPAFEGSDKLLHALAYATLCAALLWGDHPSSSTRTWRLALWVLLAAVYGITDELHQAHVPGRSTEVLDWIADSAGALLAGALWWRWSARLRARATTPGLSG